jgi:photosystem II stability/assembly factor-like uncharacterized protein
MRNFNNLLTAFFLSVLCISIAPDLLSQRKSRVPAATPASTRMENEQSRKVMEENSIALGIECVSVGPTVMSGRVTDIEVDPTDPTKFYVAYASGGLWYTSNNGASFEPLFDEEMVMSIGDIAVDWKNDERIWIGTGENNSSRSSYSGTGIYVGNRTDMNWSWKGLPESHHIGKIIVHPNDPNTAYVAALGHLYSKNKERGIYKTTDGGDNWQQVLFIQENAGAIDLAMNPANPDELYASIWERERYAWNFVESGPASGVHKSADGGTTWQLITGDGTGFPQGEGVGRIGLALQSSGESVHLYALLDNQARREKEEDEDEVYDLAKVEFLTMSKADFVNLDNGLLQSFLEDNGFPEKYDSTSTKEMVESEEIEPIAFYDYLFDANTNLFDTPVIGAEVYKLDVATGKWARTHEDYLDDIVFSYGYYFGMIRVHPNNPDKLYIAGVPILTSNDGGVNWEGITADNVHADHHALWISGERDGHIINGNDGGINISYDDGQTYYKCNSPAVGQFYTVQIDEAKPYNVYGGLQDNGVWKGPSDYEASDYWHQSGQYPYEMLMGGDGMQVEVDTRTNDIVYTGYQFGHYYRIEEESNHYFHPQHELGEKPLRWNWQTPIELSSHNQDILYMGSNKFHRSMDRGETWTTLSDDLTLGFKEGDVPYGSISTMSESIHQFGLIYVGTDDGLIHRSKDGGLTWTRISDDLPQHMWVSRVIASTHDENRVYATLNGYRWDHFDAMAYVSNDQGKSWKRIGNDIPREPVNVICEDPENEDLLFVGTDHGLYTSVNGGDSFMKFGQDLPAVAVHDLVIQEREADLVIGTHGRSIYIANIEHLQQHSDTLGLIVFEDLNRKYRSNWGAGKWSKWLGYNEPEMMIPCYLNSTKGISIEIKSDSGDVVKSMNPEKLFNGVNYISYDLTIDDNKVDVLNAILDEDNQIEEADNGKFYLAKGNYTLSLSDGTKTSEVSLVIE